MDKVLVEQIFEAIKNKQAHEAERLANQHIVNAYKNILQRKRSKCLQGLTYVF